MPDLITQLCQIVAEEWQKNSQVDQTQLIAKLKVAIDRDPEFAAAIQTDKHIVQINQGGAKAFQTWVTGGVANIGVNVDIEAFRAILEESLLELNNWLQQRSEFFTPNLEYFSSPSFVRLHQNRVEEIISRICRHRLVLLGGNLDVDSVEIPRYLAWYLSQELVCDENASNHKNIVVKEWRRSSDSQSIEEALQTSKTPTIFVLTQIVPQNVSFGLHKIRRAAELGNHFVIASTEVSLNNWNLSTRDKELIYYEISLEGFYNVDDLTRNLINEIEKISSSLAQSFKEILKNNNKGSSEESAIRNGFYAIAERLKTPERIDQFVRLLKAEKQELKFKIVNNLIDIAQDSDKTLNYWFYNVLNPQEQLLALGLNFFTGLSDDQCLAAVGELVRHEWYRREPSLLALDYYDLKNLEHFFTSNEIQPGKNRIIQSQPSQRLRLFKIAWDSYRLRLQTALPVIVWLVKNSVGSIIKDFGRISSYGIPIGQQLYGSIEKRRQLRLKISEAISDLGKINENAIYETLLKLATERDADVRKVAADSVAKWYNSIDRNNQKFFSILEALHLDSKKYGSKDNREVRECILSTIALTVGYATKFYEPNRIPEELYKWLVTLINDAPSAAIVWSDTQILRILASRHALQLRNELFKLAQNKFLSREIIYDLELSYRRNAEETIDVLNEWYEERTISALQKSSSLDAKRALLRENISLVIASACVRIQSSRATDYSKTQNLFNYLYKILSEANDQMRLEVLDEICQQILKNFERVEAWLSKLLNEFTYDEWIRISDYIGKKHHSQLQNPGNSGTLINNDHCLPYWIDSNREPTDVERIMFGWLKLSKNPAAQITGANLLLGQLLEIERVVSLLNVWYAKAVDIQITMNDASVKPKLQELLLTSIGLIAIQNLCNKSIKKDTARKLYSYLHTTLRKEECSFIRESIVAALCYQLKRSLRLTERYVESLIVELKANELNQVMEALVEIHNQQFKVLRLEDNSVGKDFPYWYSERQRTSVEEVMFRWLKDGSNITARIIGATLILGYRIEHKKILDILTLWYRECEITHAQSIDKSRTALREYLLIALVLTLIKIQNANEFDGIIVQQADQYLKKILNNEQHPFVRKLTIDGFCFYTQKNFDQFEMYLESLVPNLNSSERHQIIKALNEVYYQQYSSLEARNEKSTVAGLLPFWISPKYKTTPLEYAMVRWLSGQRRGSNIVAQTIGASLILGYSIEHDKALPVLNLWYRKCTSSRAKPTIQSKITPYELLLLAIALQSIEIMCSERLNEDIVKQVSWYLQQALVQKQHLFVRKSIINAICFQIQNNFEQIAFHLNFIINQLNVNERSWVVEIIPQYYFDDFKNSNPDINEGETSENEDKGVSHPEINSSTHSAEKYQELEPEISTDQATSVLLPSSGLKSSLNKDLRTTTNIRTERPTKPLVQKTIRSNYGIPQWFPYSIIAAVTAIGLLIGFGIPSSKLRAEQVLKHAVNKIEEGNYQEAVKNYTEAISLNPNSVDAYYRRGNLYYYLGRYQAALVDYTQAINFAPNFAHAYYKRGLVRQLLNDEQGAIKDYKNALKLYQQQGDSVWSQETLEQIRLLERR